MMNLSTYRGDEDSIESVYEDLITIRLFLRIKDDRVEKSVLLTTKKLKR